jgi:hypothetical protein
MTAFVLALVVIGCLLPAAVALLRGKIVIAVVCGLVVLIATPVLFIMPPIAVIIWFVALFIGGLAGRRRVIVVHHCDHRDLP